MLESVITPEGKTVTFEYDALGRRTAKTSDGTARMFCWDGNVLLHEWECKENERPRLVTDDMGRESYDRKVTFVNVITWVYDGQSFTPVAKVTEQERYTIVHDYLGTPTQAYDSKGKLVWEMLLDVYGNAKEYAGEKCFIPFRYQGQYEDNETCLYYNRFRYYDTKLGSYISQDSIRLAGNNPTLYGYVQDLNICLDVFGLIVLAGNATMPKGIRVPQDIQPDEQGMIKSQADIMFPQGKSTFNTPENMATILRNTTVYEIIDETQLPEGLAIKADGRDVGGPMAIGHHTIYNTRDMTLEEFEQKLSEIQTRKIGKIDKNGNFTRCT